MADQGFTDEWYNLEKSYNEAAEVTIAIRLIGVNDAPVVEIPSYVLKYQIETLCEYDWSRSENIIGAMCPLDSSTLDLNSRVPPMRKGSTGEMQVNSFRYGVATISRLLKRIDL